MSVRSAVKFKFMEFENIFTISPVKLTISIGSTMNLLGKFGSDFSSDDEDFVVGVQTPRTTVNAPGCTPRRTTAGLHIILDIQLQLPTGHSR